MVIGSSANTNPCPGDNYFIIIVAAGSGSRFGSDVPKQFLELRGKTVLQYAIDTFKQTLPGAEVIVVLSPSGKEIWHDICQEKGYELPTIVIGGASRTESVHNALKSIADRVNSRSVVMIHDGARPLVSSAMIERVARAFDNESTEAVVPVVALTEAIASYEADTVTPTDRANYRTVQTPQAFRAEILEAAYSNIGDAVMPDDAAAYTAFTGRRINTVEGDYANIKITNPRDLLIADILMK